MQQLDVAIYASAIRVHLWQNLYKKLASTNECTFKIFFCGHIKPDFELPENFIYIHSEMTAAPCVEIARRHAINSNSKFVMNFCDDCIIPDQLLDRLVSELNDSKEELVVGPSYRVGLKETKDLELKLVIKDPNSPLVPIWPMMKRSTMIKVGGIDKRFKAIWWDLDILLRLYELGSVSFKVLDNIRIIEDERPSSRSNINLFKDNFIFDGPLFYGFYAPGLKFGDPLSIWKWWPIKRTEPVQYYSEDDLKFSIYSKESK